MISKYLRIRKKDDQVVVFHELHPDPIYCSLKKWEQFVSDQKSDDVFVEGLKKRKLLVDQDVDDQAEYDAVSTRLQKKHCQAGTLYLMTVQGCNFNCGYCFVPELARKFGEFMLTEENAIAGINLWYEHLKVVHDPNVEYFVIFYGGEPLLNKAVIEKSLPYLKKMKSITGLPGWLNLMIVTNGLLVDDPVISMCKEYDIMVVVSLDGPKPVHDSLRVDTLSNGTYEAVVAAIKKLVASGIRTFGSVTITPQNINRLGEVSDHLTELGVEKIGFNFIKGKKLIELVGKDGVGQYCEQAAKAVLEYSHSHKFSSEYQLEKKVHAFNEQDFFPHDCTCYGSQLVIQPDGQISNCPFFKARLGHVKEVGKDFRIWDQSLVHEWRKRLPLYSQGFRNNDAKALCGAGCAWSSEELYGDILAVDQISRIFGEEVFNELIWSKQ